MVDAHLADAFADRLDVAKVAGSGQAENSGIDSGDGLPIFQLGKPDLEGVALMDFNHGRSVIHDSHIDKEEKPRPWARGLTDAPLPGCRDACNSAA